MAILTAIYTQLSNDATLMASLTGGIYLARDLPGLEISRQDTEDAFDDNQELLPCALIRSRPPVPFSTVYDLGDRLVSISQMVEIYYYQYRGVNVINTAKERVFTLMFGTQYAGAYEALWALETPPIPDFEALNNVIVVRQEWQIISLRSGVVA